MEHRGALVEILNRESLTMTSDIHPGTAAGTLGFKTRLSVLTTSSKRFTDLLVVYGGLKIHARDRSRGFQ